jgi:hypothetical protein
MTKRTRLFLIGAAGILVIGLGTGVIASYMGLQNVVIGGDGPSELAYVPSDARAVAFANVRDVMDSELRRKLLGLRSDTTADDPANSGPKGGFFEATGLDIETDLDSVVATLSGPGSEKEHPLVVARGRFNNGLIETAILEHADDRQGRVETYNGTRMVLFPQNSEVLAVAFAEPGLLVLGTETSVRRALDGKTSGENITRNDELMKLVRDSDDGNAWAVARFDALTDRAGLPQELTSQLPAITWFSMSGYINGGLRAIVRAETRDDAAAQNLREVIRGFVALARLQTGQRAEFDELMNSIELGGVGTTVSLGFTIDSAMIDALGAMQERLAPPPPPVPPVPPAPVL